MRRGMGHRKALFDIGISGPLAGLIPTIIFLIVGLHYSGFATPVEGDFGVGSPLLFRFGDIGIGPPLLFRFLAEQLVGQPPYVQVIDVHPMAFAGWVGLLITSLNLIPIGQLDGGHILYALLREKANRVASLLLLFAAIAIALDLRNLGNWIPMLILVYFLVGTAHPPTADDNEPLGLGRIVLGWLTLAFILIGFTPTPIRMQ
jgi:membrane-associated protease RseP (regulator of RpoE activity)